MFLELFDAELIFDDSLVISVWGSFISNYGLQCLAIEEISEAEVTKNKLIITTNEKQKYYIKSFSKNQEANVLAVFLRKMFTEEEFAASKKGPQAQLLHQ